MHPKPSILLTIVFTLATVQLISASTLYQCVKFGFQNICKSELYACTNNPQCSYQLNQNTQQVFLTPESSKFPPVYFSNDLAIQLYNCLKQKCDLPDLDSKYLSTLSKDQCMINVYSICGGDIDMIYRSKNDFDSIQKRCYQKYCNWKNINQNLVK